MTESKKTKKAKTRIGNHWHELVGNLHVWRRGSERAVHKPLLTLMLLSRAQRGEANEVRFEEIYEPLREALRNFGPPRKSYHPEFPFWHLQTDGFWEIEEVDKLERKKGGSSPSRTELLKKTATGRVPEPLWAELKSHRHTIRDLAQNILDEFWPATYHEDIAAALGLDLTLEQSIEKAKRDPRFRHLVLRAYERKCAICGYDARIGDTLAGVEAAHIKWKTVGGPDIVKNGIALCSIHHKMFDLGAVGLTPGLTIQVSQDLTGDKAVKELVHRYHGKPLAGPQSSGQEPKRDFIHWHEKNVFRAPARETG